MYEAVWDRTAECARPIAKLDYDEYSLEYRTISYAGHPEGCGGFKRSAHSAVPTLMLRDLGGWMIRMLRGSEGCMFRKIIEKL